MEKPRGATPSRPPASNPPASSGGKRWRGFGQRGVVGDPTGKRRGLRIIGGVFALTIVIALIVVLIWWLKPLPPIATYPLAADYKSDALPLNPHALDDAAALAAQQVVDSTKSGAIVSIDAATLDKRIDQIASDEPSRLWWYPWSKTTTLVYVNMFGVTLWDDDSEHPERVACLLPDDFVVPTTAVGFKSSKAVPVRRLIDKLLDAKSDHKILVLDCQRFDRLWPLGVLDNDFVDAINSELDSMYAKSAAKFAGFHVILSCSPGEAVWTTSTFGRSPFAEFFARGITGQADVQADQQGNHNGRVDLQELADYLKNSVDQWVGANRADTQTPMLRSFQNEASKVELAVRSDFVEVASSEVNLPAELKKLQDQWKTYYELAASAPSPWQYAAHHWRYLEDSLLRAEAALRAGESSKFDDELTKTKSSISRIRDARGEYPLNSTSYSLAMKKLIDATAVPTDKSKSTASADDFGRIIDDFIRPAGIAPKAAADRIATLRVTLKNEPIEALILRAAVAPASLANGAKRSDELRELIKRRKVAEEAAVAGDLLAPQAHRWIRRLLDAADKERRPREDLDLAPKVEQTFALPIQSADRNLKNDARLYATALETANQIAAALALRDQVLAELPHIARFATQRPWDDADLETKSNKGKLRDYIAAGTAQSLADLAADLSQRFLRDPLDMNDVASEVAAIEVQAVKLRKERTELLNLLAELITAMVSGGAPTQNDWRRINELLAVPFACGSKPPADLAADRMKLLRSALDWEEPNGRRAETGERLSSGAALDKEQRQKLASRNESFATALYSDCVVAGARAAAKDAAKDIEDAGVRGVRVSRVWRDLHHRAVPPEAKPNSFAKLTEAEAGLRVLEGSYARAASNNHIQALRRRCVSDFFDWHAGRVADDFWVGIEEAPDNVPANSYFARAAEAYLSARPNDAELKEQLKTDPTRTRVNTLINVSRKLDLEWDPRQIALKGILEQKLRLGLRAPDGFSPGFGLVHYQPDSPDVQLPPAVVDETNRERPLGLLVRAPQPRNPAVLRTSLTVNQFFRGRRRSDQIEVVFARPGNLVTRYEDLRDPTAQLKVRLADNEPKVKLLLVLDSSLSMEEPGFSGETKMQSLKRVLRDFAELPSAADMEIGVRLLGHSKVWTDGKNKQQEDAAKTDTESKIPIGPFNKRTFVREVDNLKSVGATPLFYALKQAKSDFSGVRGGKKVVLLISDGQDNWANKVDWGEEAFQKAISDLRQHWGALDVRIHAIGFKTKKVEFEQLASIADAFQGTAVASAAQTQGLLEQIEDLSERLKYQVIRDKDDEPLWKKPQPLTTQGEPIQLERAGRYTIEVGKSGNSRKFQRKIDVERSQLHELFVSGGTLDYGPLDLRNQITRDKAVFSAVHFAKPQDKGVDFTIALFKPNDFGWRPTRISLLVKPRGKSETYALHDRAPNVVGYPVPVWRFTADNWPKEIDEAEIEARWTDDAPKDEPIKFSELKPDLPAGMLPPGISIGPKPDISRRELGGQRRTVARITLLFDKSRSDLKDFAEWSIGASDPTIRVETVWNTDERIFSGEYTLRHDGPPEALVIRRPLGQAKVANQLTAIVRIGAKAVLLRE